MTVEECWLLLHIEVHSQEETGFAERMFVYNYRLTDRYHRDVVSVAVLGDERPSWRPKSYAFSKWGCRKEFEFPIVKFVDFLIVSEEMERDDNPIATVVLAHLRAMQTRKDPDERHRWKIQFIRNLYEKGMAADEVRRLFRLIDWFMQLPKDLEVKFREQVVQIEEEKTCRTSQALKDLPARKD